MSRIFCVAMLGLLLLAGCATEEPKNKDSSFEVCPYWDVVSDGTTLGLSGATALNWSAPAWDLENGNGTLDYARITINTFDSAGSVDLRAFIDGQQVSLYLAGAESPRVPKLALTPDLIGEHIEIHYSNVAHGSDANAGNLTLQFDAAAPWGLNATVDHGYRVCGL